MSRTDAWEDVRTRRQPVRKSWEEREISAAKKRRRQVAAMSEDEIQIAVIAHLEACAKPGVAWGHFANGGKRSKVEAARFKAMGVVAGMPDLPIFTGGITRMIEIKTEVGVLSGVQHDAHTWLREAGIEVVTCYGLDACLRQLAAWGVLRGTVSA